MTSRAPQTKHTASAQNASGAKKLSASAQLSREAAPASVSIGAPSSSDLPPKSGKARAHNLLKSPPGPAPRSHARNAAPVQPGKPTSSPRPPSARKEAMSNKTTAPAKDTTQEYREDSVEETAV